MTSGGSHTINSNRMSEPPPVCRRAFGSNLRLLDDLESNMDNLIMFRETCARIAILLLSGLNSRDEFSDHCRAIGDVTLRKPVFRSRLLAGIDAMKVNQQAQRKDPHQG